MSIFVIGKKLAFRKEAMLRGGSFFFFEAVGKLIPMTDSRIRMFKDDEGRTILSRHDGGTSGYERGRCVRWNCLWAHSLKKDAIRTFPMKMEERGTRDCNMQMRTEISSPVFVSPRGGLGKIIWGVSRLVYN